MKDDKRAARAREKAKQGRVARQQTNDLSRLGTHVGLINQQIEACDEFLHLPGNLLADMARRLDSGESFPDDVAEDCVAILDKVKEDADQFNKELGELKVKADAFRKEQHDTVSMTMGSIGICEDLEMLRNKYINLYAIDTSSINALISDPEQSE